MKIKEMCVRERPRERLKKDGVSCLSNSELLGVVLGNGSRKENVVDMCNRLISNIGMKKLSKSSLKELQEFHGVGFCKACQILALFEFCKRVEVIKNERVIIKSAKDVFNYIYPKVKDLDKEHFIVLMLDTRNGIIKDEVVSVGTLNSSLIHPREVFKSAIKESANALILVHNHPSGDCSPSDEDIDVTKKLIKVGEVVGIKVLDHVIVGGGKWWSWDG